MKKRVVIISSVVLTVAVIVGILCCILIPKNKNKDITEIKGKEISFTQGIQYCAAVSDISLDDDLSVIYANKTFITVLEIDETKENALISIKAPPLKQIMEACFPTDFSDDYESLFDEYMQNIQSAIQNCAEKDLVISTVTCNIVEENGLKIVVNDEFAYAVYPEINSILSELLLQYLEELEG